MTSARFNAEARTRTRTRSAVGAGASPTLWLIKKISCNLPTLFMDTLIIINQAAAKARRAWPIIQRQLDAADFRYESYQTKAPGDATQKTRTALRNGTTTVAVVG